LKSIVHEIDDNVFSHHVNSDRNDFATWVKDIHKDDALASMLREAKTKPEIASAISDRIKQLVPSLNHSVVLKQPVTAIVLVQQKIAGRVMKSALIPVPVLNKKSASNKSEELPMLKEPIIIKTSASAGKHGKRATVSFPEEEDESSDEPQVLSDSAKVPEEESDYTIDMLRPKGSIKKSFFPFFNSNQETEDKHLEVSDKKVDEKEASIHKCPNRQFMQCGVYDFFKGVIFGLIIGALLAMTVL